MVIKPEIEKATKDAIKKLLTELWPDVWQIMVVPGGFGTGGVPDHVACVPVVITPEMVGKTYGMLVAVEAKKPKGEFRGLQRIQVANIVKAGGFGQITKGVAQVEILKQQLKDRFCLI